MIRSFIAKHEGRLRYLAVGGWNTIFGYSLFVTLHWMFSDRLHYLLILIIAHVVSIINAYIGYKYFVFKTQGNVASEFARFNFVYAVLLGFNLAALPFLVEVLMLNVPASQAIIVCAATILSYIGHKRVTFSGQ